MNTEEYNHKQLKEENERLKNELKNLKVKFQKQHDKFYNLFDRSLAGIFRANTTGDIMDANHAFAKLLGYESAEALLGDKNTGSPLKYFWDSNQINIKLPSTTESEVNKEIVFTNKKDDIKFGLLSWYIVSEGKDTFIEGNLIDITRQREMEEEVNRYNLMLRNTQKMAKIAFFDYCVDSRKTVWSDEVGALFGSTPPKNGSFDWFMSYVHKDDREFVQSSYENSIGKKQEEININYRIVDNNGDTKYMHCRFKNYYAKNEYSGTSGWIQDMSIVRSAQEELKKNLNMMESILNTIPVSVFWKNKQLKYLGSNKQFLDDAGINYPKDLKGKSDAELPWKAQAEEYMLDDDQFVLDTGEAQLNFEGPLLKADGNMAWIKANKVPLRNSEGEIIGLLGVYEDITTWKKTQNELMAAYEKVEESDRLKTSFLANISHEIRTPLSAIVGFSDMLGKGDIPQEEVNYFTRLIQNQADHLLKIVSDILDISLIESNQLKIEGGSIDLIPLLKDQFVILKNQLKQLNNDHIRAQLSLPDIESLHVKGDLVRVRQILNNLIDNAIKFTQFGFIEVGCQMDNDKNILLFVKDSGVGIDPKVKESIFIRFRQGDESYSKMFPGLGLGLSIAKELTDRMNGELWVDSEAGMGSSFYFTLPLNTDKVDKTIPSPTKLPSEGVWRNKTILVADDVKHLHQLINLYVRDQGIRVISAMDGEQAIELHEQHPEINLIFMDIQMPRIDGVKAMQRIKEIDPDIPIVAFTAYAMAGDSDKYLNLGFNDYLSKPLNQEELWQLFARYL